MDDSLSEILNDINFSLEAILEIVRKGDLAPLDIISIKKTIETFIIRFHEEMAEHYLISEFTRGEIQI